MDSNHVKVNQNHLCYRYTTGLRAMPGLRGAFQHLPTPSGRPSHDGTDLANTNADRAAVRVQALMAQGSEGEAAAKTLPRSWTRPKPLRTSPCPCLARRWSKSARLSRSAPCGVGGGRIAGIRKGFNRAKRRERVRSPFRTQTPKEGLPEPTWPPHRGPHWEATARPQGSTPPPIHRPPRQPWPPRTPQHTN